MKKLLNDEFYCVVKNASLERKSGQMRLRYFILALMFLFCSNYNYAQEVPNAFDALQAWYDTNSEVKKFLHEEAERTHVKRRGLEPNMGIVSARCAVPLTSAWAPKDRGLREYTVTVSCAQSVNPSDSKGWSVDIPTVPMENIEIVRVGNPVYTAEQDNSGFISACREWRLSAKQVKTLFESSERYATEETPTNAFYWLPCEIRGALKSDGVEWNFVINAAATAVWYRDKKKIHWGCKERECSSLFLLTYDGMSAHTLE